MSPHRRTKDGEAAASAAAQHAGVRELIRIAQVQQRAYASDALGLAVPAPRRPVDDKPPAPRHRRRGGR